MKLTCFVNGHNYAISDMQLFAVGLTLLECENCGKTKEIQDTPGNSNLSGNNKVKNKNLRVRKKNNGDGNK